MSADRIREAVHAGDYSRAVRLLAEYSQSLPVNRTSLDEVADLTCWVRITALCAHAHAQGRLQSTRDELQVLAAYARSAGNG
jgi:hypothetical protein